MPHYPDEIEYSDKYLDDHYEYRHVLLPKDVYKKIPRGRLLNESVLIDPCRSGELSECNSHEDGFTISCIDQNHIFSCLEDPRILTHRQDYPRRDLCHPQILSAIDMITA